MEGDGAADCELVEWSSGRRGKWMLLKCLLVLSNENKVEVPKSFLISSLKIRLVRTGHKTTNAVGNHRRRLSTTLFC